MDVTNESAVTSYSLNMPLMMSIGYLVMYYNKFLWSRSFFVLFCCCLFLCVRFYFYFYVLPLLCLKLKISYRIGIQRTPKLSRPSLTPTPPLHLPPTLCVCWETAAKVSSSKPAPKEKPGMSDVLSPVWNLKLSVSGCPGDRTLLSSLLICFNLALLLWFSVLVITSSDYIFFFSRNSSIFFIKRLLCMDLVQQLGDDNLSLVCICSKLPHGAGICHYACYINS